MWSPLKFSLVREVIQQDGRIRRWAPIAEMEGRYLRAILLPDGETVPNAFFDRQAWGTLHGYSG